MIRAILACDGKGGIAKNGIMPWPRNKVDLAHFKKLTKNCTVVMGKATWEAPDMPTPLPFRDNVVVTSDVSYVAEGAVVSSNITTDLTSLAEHNTVFVIGGAKLFSTLIDEINVLHLTRITGNYDCDTFIPMDDIAKHFELIDCVTIDLMTTFETYIKRQPHDISFRADV